MARPRLARRGVDQLYAEHDHKYKKTQQQEDESIIHDVRHMQSSWMQLTELVYRFYVYEYVTVYSQKR